MYRCCYFHFQVPQELIYFRCQQITHSIEACYFHLFNYNLIHYYFTTHLFYLSHLFMFSNFLISSFSSFIIYPNQICFCIICVILQINLYLLVHQYSLTCKQYQKQFIFISLHYFIPTNRLYSNQKLFIIVHQLGFKMLNSFDFYYSLIDVNVQSDLRIIFSYFHLISTKYRF